MTYLLAQMIFGLVLAGICGAAIGWLIHRKTHTEQTNKLRHAVHRQHQQIGQLRSETSMLTDDYDDLHQRTQEEIFALREQNQQIPVLNTNLEKSQLLVRQMMQKHEAKLRDLTATNQSLTEQLKQQEDRSQAYNKLQADKDLQSRQNAKSAAPTDNSAGSANTATATGTHQIRDSLTGVAVAATAIAGTVAAGKAATASAKDHAPASEAVEPDLAEPAADSKQADDDTLEMDTVVSIEDYPPVEQPQPADDSIADSSITVSSATDSSITSSPASDNSIKDEPPRRSSWASAPVSEVDVVGTAMPVADVTDTDMSDEVIEIDDDMLSDIDSEAAEADAHSETDSETQVEAKVEVNADADSSSLFDPVEQHDDLQQIVGIGPHTEKALNEMGITSYAPVSYTHLTLPTILLV